MHVIVALGAIAVVFLAVGLIVTAIEWLTIIALVFGLLALAQFYRERRR